MKTHTNLRYVLILAITALFSLYGAATELTVTNNNDNGSGSLRQTVYDAADGDSITFSEAFTIYLDSTINLGDKSLSINGQVGNDQVHLDGNYADADNDTIDDDNIFCRPITIVGDSINKASVNIYNLVVEHGNLDVYEYGKSYGKSYVYIKGGAIYSDMSSGGSLLVENCTIQENILTVYEREYPDSISYLYANGAGIYSKYGGEFNNCIIKNNKIISTIKHLSRSIGGVGISVLEEASIKNTIIVGNTLYSNSFQASVFAAGVALFDNCLLQNSIIIGNTIKTDINDSILGQAAGIYSYGHGSEISNCNISYNSCTSFLGVGGGVIFQGDGEENSKIINSIISDNCLTSTYAQVSNISIGSNTEHEYLAVLDSTDLPTNEEDRTGWIVLEESPYREDPSPGADSVWGTDDDYYGDLRLKDSSLCINAGNADSLSTVPATDYYGNDRILEDTIDIGAHEYKRDEDEDGIANVYDNCWETANTDQGDFDEDGIGDVCEDSDGDSYVDSEDAFPADSTEWADCDSDGTGDNTDPFPCDARDPYSLSGIVYTSVGTLSSGTVYVYDTDNTDAPADSCTVESDGSYEFSALLPEDYYVLATPDASVSGYASTYFGNVSNMSDASVITLDANTSSVDITLSSLSTGTGDKSVGNNDIVLYPVPAYDYILIETGYTGKMSVTICDILDKTVLETSYSAGEKIPVSDLPNGVYIVSINQDGKQITARFIKQ